MKNPTRTIWVKPGDPQAIQIVDQRNLPHQLFIADITSSDEACIAIKDMWVRGAPLIGAMAAYGMYLAALKGEDMQDAYNRLYDTRPTAVNLQWALKRQMETFAQYKDGDVVAALFQGAGEIVEEDVEICRLIGVYGLEKIEEIYARTRQTVNILTHCNAGRMATIEWGTATSPIYQAHNKGIPVHVWVDETRPRNQGARITAWELAQAGIPHTVIVDNVGGHLMQHGMVDICFVGTDRTTRCGDVGNKIGTYLKALAAHDNGVPFYVGVPSSSVDWTLCDGVKEIPIEERGGEEVGKIWGWDEKSKELRQVKLTPAESPVANFAFDVTPAKYITGLITERGIAEANEDSLLAMFPEHRQLA